MSDNRKEIFKAINHAIDSVDQIELRIRRYETKIEAIRSAAKILGVSGEESEEIVMLYSEMVIYLTIIMGNMTSNLNGISSLVEDLSDTVDNSPAPLEVYVDDIVELIGPGDCLVFANDYSCWSIEYFEGIELNRLSLHDMKYFYHNSVIYNVIRDDIDVDADAGDIHE